MVEGHSVHRTVVSLGRRIVGRNFRATSPNGRFVDGAKAIDGRKLDRLEAVGKNLFAWFTVADAADVVVHVHFGMSGRWSAMDARKARSTTKTTRLKLEGHGLVSHVSAMSVAHGGQDLFDSKFAALGEDPLREDADPKRLWTRVSRSKKSIGALLMDQSYFAGVGNIFRCEILHVAGVHPNLSGKDLTYEKFNKIWDASVRLMRRAYALGSIVTVDPDEAAAVGRPRLRRWLYNSPTCGRCGGTVTTWQINARTCYACIACQPQVADDALPEDVSSPRLFHSHCASETFEERLKTPQKLRVGELREALAKLGLSPEGKKKKTSSSASLHPQKAREKTLSSPSLQGRTQILKNQT